MTDRIIICSSFHMKKISHDHIIRWIIDHRSVLIISMIVLFGAFLRFYDFTDLLRFNNDQVRDLKIINSMISDHEFPLLGPKAGGTTFKLGPAFYYLMYGSALIFGNTPQGAALFIPILSTLSIILFYMLVKKYYANDLALIITLLYATSFYMIKYSRFAWNPNVIPFFLCAFFLVLLSTFHSTHTTGSWQNYIALGIVTGIGMQLHTTLLIILPIIILCTYIFKCIQAKKIHFLKISCTLLCIGLLFVPMIVSDIRAHGANISAFFVGSEKKSTTRRSIVENIALDAQFFIQSSTYIITGFEPTINWLNVKKHISEHNYTQIALALMCTMIFILCFTLLLYQKRKMLPTEVQKRSLYYLFIGTALLCFIIFIPVAHEITTRFFIILVFFPFILIGALMHAIQNTFSKKIGHVLITFCILGIVISNITAYVRAFDLSRTSVSSTVYGGISLMELHESIAYMAHNTTLPKVYMLPNSYSQSFRYIAQETGTPLTTKSVGNIPLQTNVFFVSDKPQKMTLSKSLNKCFTIIDTQTFGRFRTFTLQKHREDCE